MNNKSATRFSWMRMRTLLSLNTLVITASALFLCLPLRGQSPDFPDPQALQTAPGHFVTPLAEPGAVQQVLNPQLPA